MKKIRLNEVLNKIDDELINDVLKINNYKEYNEKKKEEKKEEKKAKLNKAFLFVGTSVCTVIIVLVGVIFMNNSKKSDNLDESNSFIDSSNSEVQIANPLIEVNSKKEMEEYLGYQVPVLNKKIKNYIVILQNKIAFQGRIIYEDGSDFEIAKVKNEDISGIYGAKKIDTFKISEVEVFKYKEEDVYYITWSIGEYSYSYSKIDKIDNTIIKELISITK